MTVEAHFPKPFTQVFVAGTTGIAGEASNHGVFRDDCTRFQVLSLADFKRYFDCSDPFVSEQMWAGRSLVPEVI